MAQQVHHDAHQHQREQQRNGDVQQVDGVEALQDPAPDVDQDQRGQREDQPIEAADADLDRRLGVARVGCAARTRARSKRRDLPGAEQACRQHADLPQHGDVLQIGEEISYQILDSVSPVHIAVK